MNDQDLARTLSGAVGRPLVDALSDGIWTVRVPDARMVHSYVQVVVEREADGSHTLSDASELRRLLTHDRDRVVEWLECAGADLLADGDFVTTHVDPDEDLASRILSFSHYISSAPVLWQAETCITQGGTAERAEPAVKQMAASFATRILSRVGNRAAPLVRLNLTVKGLGQRAKAPLAIAPPGGKQQLPRLLSSFIDYEASGQSIEAAKKQSLWLFDVTEELTIPKYLVVRGGDAPLSDLARFYDRRNVTTVPFDDSDQLLEDAERLVEQYA
jgi:hypothetical protein